MLLFGAVSGAATIGAFRLGQTFMGPVNLVSAALATNLLAQVTTLRRASEVRVVRMADVLGLRIAMIAAASTLVGLGIVLIPGAFPALTKTDLVLAVASVGVCACVSGFATPHLVALRVLLHQRFLTICTSLMVLVTWAGFLVGWLLGGSPPALSWAS